jgi:hypothetical protein
LAVLGPIAEHPAHHTDRQRGPGWTNATTTHPLFASPRLLTFELWA